MQDFSDDIELNHGSAVPDVVDDRPQREKWIALGVMLLLVGAIVGYSWLRRTRTIDLTPPVSVAQSDVNLKPSAAVLEGDRIPLPALAESDPLVRDLTARLSRHPQILAWLATKGLLENFAVT